MSTTDKSLAILDERRRRLRMSRSLAEDAEMVARGDRCSCGQEGRRTGPFTVRCDNPACEVVTFARSASH